MLFFVTAGGLELLTRSKLRHYHQIPRLGGSSSRWGLRWWEHDISCKDHLQLNSTCLNPFHFTWQDWQCGPAPQRQSNCIVLIYQTKKSQEVINNGRERSERQTAPSNSQWRVTFLVWGINIIGVVCPTEVVTKSLTQNNSFFSKKCLCPSRSSPPSGERRNAKKVLSDWDCLIQWND